MKAIIKYKFTDSQGMYDTEDRYHEKNCIASAEVARPDGLVAGPLTFNAVGRTYKEAKENVLKKVKNYFDNRIAPDPEIVEV